MVDRSVVRKSYFIESMVMESFSVILLLGFIIQLYLEGHSRKTTALQYSFHRIGLVISVLLVIVCIDHLNTQNLISPFWLSLLVTCSVGLLMIAFVMSSVVQFKRTKFVLSTYKPIFKAGFEPMASMTPRGTEKTKVIPGFVLPGLIALNVLLSLIMNLVSFFSVDQIWPLPIALFVFLLEMFFFGAICAKIQFECIELILVDTDSKKSKNEISESKTSLTVLRHDIAGQFKLSKVKFQEEVDKLQIGIKKGILIFAALGSGLLHAIIVMLLKSTQPASAFESVEFYNSYFPSVWLFAVIIVTGLILYQSWTEPLSLLRKVWTENLRTSDSAALSPNLKESLI